MPLNYNGTDIKEIIYNGVSLDKVIYNGVVVFEKITTPDSWYASPSVFCRSSYIEITNNISRPLIIKITGQQGVSFNVNDNDEFAQYKTNVILKANNTAKTNWYWIGSMAQPTTVDFKISVYVLENSGERLLESFWEMYEEETTTYTLGDVTSNEGNFTYYQGGNNK